MKRKKEARQRDCLVVRGGGRVLRVFLASALFFCDGSSLRAGRDLWSERQKAVHAARTADAPGGRVWEKLSVAFPPLEEVAPRPGPASPAGLPDWLESAVGLHADLGEFFPPSGKERRVLIHIQDLHDVEEAQRNTAAVLEQLAKSLGGKSGLPVGVEGAAGEFRTEDFRALAAPRGLQRTANRFLKAGFISGPEYFSLTTETPVRLWGAEDARAYAANIASLTQSMAGQAKDDARVSEARRLVHGLKAVLYPPALKELDDLRTRYEEGSLGLASYARSLADGALTEMGPNLQVFLRATAEEEVLSVARVEEDQKRFLEALAPRLSEPEIRRWMEAGLAYRLGRAPYASFHAVLKDLGGRHGLSLNDYPGLTDYAAYAAKADGLNRAELWREIDALAEERFKALRTTPALEELAAMDADLRLIKKLNDFSLSSEEFKRFIERRETLRRWSERGESLSRRVPARSGPWPNLVSVMDRHAGFYRWAEERNAPLVKNLLARWTGSGLAVLVAGGYHAEGLRLEAMSRGLGYIALIPRVASTKNLPGSLDSFRNHQRPLDWFYRGTGRGFTNPSSPRPCPSAWPPIGHGNSNRFSSIRRSSIRRASSGPFPRKRPVARWRKPFTRPGGSEWIGAHRSDSGRTSPVGERRLLLSFKATESGAGRPGGKMGPGRHFDSWVALPASGMAAVGKEGEVPAQSVRAVGSGSDVFEKIILIFVSLSERGNVFSLVSRDRIATALVRVLSGVGRATATAARVGATALQRTTSWLGFGWVARPTARWVESLQMEEERRFRDLALQAEPGARASLLYRLAEAHAYGDMEEEWQISLLSAAKEIIKTSPLLAFQEPPVAELSPDRTTLNLRLAIGGKPVALRLRVSNARVLFEEPGEHSLFQISQALEEGVYDVFIQLPALATAGEVPNRVLARALREVVERVGGATAGEAHARALAVDPRGELLNRKFLQLRLLTPPLEKLDNRILGLGRRLPVLGIPAVRSAEDWRVQFFTWLKNPEGTPLFVKPEDLTTAVSNGGFAGFAWGLNPSGGLNASEWNPAAGLEKPGPLTEALSRGGGAEGAAQTWAATMTLLHLKEKIAVLDLFSSFIGARWDLRSYWPGSKSRADLIDLSSDLVLGYLNSVGRESGQLAALQTGSFASGDTENRRNALADSIRDCFAPAAQSIIGLLMLTGVRFGNPGDVPTGEFVRHLLRVYCARFEEGFRRMAPLSTADAVAANPGTADRWAVGVFHLTSPVETSREAAELLANLMERARAPQGGAARVMALLDFEGAERLYPESSSLLSALRTRLADTFPDTAERAAADRALLALDAFHLARARDFERDGKISLDRLLSQVRRDWASSGTVQIFTVDRDRILDDVKEELMSWVLYLLVPQGLIRVSDSMEAARSAERIRAFIRQNA
ncbi:MAG: hypothetical protein IPP35_04900 [Elusimicrobia bacterium]|nr:hypothetical protein [Elusimicrobiota bacterium]